MIEIRELKKSFGDHKVLENITITIQEHDIYGLVGKSGAGKSTLLRCINGLEAYDSGSLLINGVEVRSLDKTGLRLLRKDVAMIFQHFPLMSRKTVYENIAFPMQCWKYDKRQIDAKVRELSEIVGITEKLNQKPHTLSGGQKQRVAIARALTMEPKVLLSDEATSALDPSTTQSILHLLRTINERLGITIIVVTHQMAVVRKICNNVSLLHQGELVASGKVEELFLNQPAELKEFFGEQDAIPTQEGVNLQIMLLDGDASKAVLSALAQDLKIPFSVVGGKMDRYRDKHLGSLIVNFREADIPGVTAYLHSQGVIWHRFDVQAQREEGLEDGE